LWFQGPARGNVRRQRRVFQYLRKVTWSGGGGGSSQSRKRVPRKGCYSAWDNASAEGKKECGEILQRRRGAGLREREDPERKDNHKSGKGKGKDRAGEVQWKESPSL